MKYQMTLRNNPLWQEMNSREGFLNFRGYKTYYIVYGDPSNGKTPLICLHGGPGYPHYHLENVSELAKDGRAVILYDQLGCGKSDRPDDPSLWTIEFFIDELIALGKKLALDHVNILGHSWGGSLAAEYVLTKPAGVEKLILSSPLLDSQRWVAEANRLIDGLPSWAANLMREHERAGTTDSYEYQQAYMEFRKRYICRAEPYPISLAKADNEMGTQVYITMWGPSEPCATGTLKNWSVMDRLHEIKLPTLFLSGKYDEATPRQIELAHKKLSGSKWVQLEHSSHSANFEEPEKYLATVEDFLRS